MLREAWGAAISFVRLAHRRAAGKEIVQSRVMSSKRGNKNYYKGKGVPSVGKLSRKGMSLGAHLIVDLVISSLFLFEKENSRRVTFGHISKPIG